MEEAFLWLVCLVILSSDKKSNMLTLNAPMPHYSFSIYEICCITYIRAVKINVFIQINLFA